MRLLSLGCHDGFVEHWVRQELPGLEVCGVELNRQAVGEACKRGIDCKQGRAEDAFKLFDSQSFDAVVAYELLEHVPDVERLLGVCEQMVRPGGQIFISTPDGTFGAGGNPHHLRAYRSVELADMLRRRGKLLSFAVPDDHVSVGCYSPAPKRGEIAIFTGPTMLWHPMDIESKGLGGSETAAYRVADALSRLGYVVTLYGQFAQEGAMRDLILRDWRVFDPTVPRQAVISSRIPSLFDRPVNAKHRILWTHDTDYAGALTPERAEQITHVLALSDWHIHHLHERYDFLNGKVRKVRNGITPAYYRPRKGLERNKRVVYSSSPDRGLDILLRLWPLVLERVPDAELVCCYPDYFDQIADSTPELAEFRTSLKEAMDQPGVKAAGSLPLPSLVELLQSSLVWAHPSYNSPNGQKFHETFCISAVEAQACGLRCVAGGWGALPETVYTGVLVEGDPTTDAWQRQFADYLIEGLTNPSVQELAQTAGPQEVASMDWDGVGDLIAEMLSG